MCFSIQSVLPGSRVSLEPIWWAHCYGPSFCKANFIMPALCFENHNSFWTPIKQAWIPLSSPQGPPKFRLTCLSTSCSNTAFPSTWDGASLSGRLALLYPSIWHFFVLDPPLWAWKYPQCLIKPYLTIKPSLTSPVHMSLTLFWITATLMGPAINIHWESTTGWSLNMLFWKYYFIPSSEKPCKPIPVTLFHCQWGK